MRTTLNSDDETLAQAARPTGVTAQPSLVRLGPEALVAAESGGRLARLGGTEKGLRPILRRR